MIGETGECSAKIPNDAKCAACGHTLELHFEPLCAADQGSCCCEFFDARDWAYRVGRVAALKDAVDHWRAYWDEFVPDRTVRWMEQKIAELEAS